MEVKLFEDQPDVVRMFEFLNQQDESLCVQAFRRLAERMSDPDLTHSIFTMILDRVAFFPAKPALLQQELLGLGVRASLAEKLSQVWAATARKIVAEKKKVQTDLTRIDFEVVREVKTQGQTVNLYLHDQLDRITLLSFTPQQLFSFYQKLESIQTSIDSICK